MLRLFERSRIALTSVAGLLYVLVVWSSPSHDPQSGAYLSAIPGFNQKKLLSFSNGKGIGRLDSIGPGWFRITTRERPPKKYSVAINVNTTRRIEKEKPYLLEFEARTLSSENETGAGQVYCFVERNVPPFEKAFMQTVPLPRKWTALRFPFKSKYEFESGNGRLGIGFGFLPQAVEIRSVKLSQLSDKADLNAFSSSSFSAYEGQDSAASWRREALQRIEQHRKSWLNIRILNAAGKPISKAEITLKQKRNVFGFGCCVDAIAMANRTPAGEKYRDYVLRNFNKVVFQGDMKWKAWEDGKHAPATARYSRQALLASLDWLEKNHIAVRGHLLVHNVLDQNSFGGFKTRNNLLRQMDDHIDDKVSALKGRICEWDVVNHPVGWGKRLDEVIGRESFAGFYDRVWKIDPAAKRYINEGNILPGGDSDEGTRRKEYEEWISFLQTNHAKLDGIGFMGHFDGASLTSPSKVYGILDRFARFGLDLQITELDISGVSEQLQADYLRDILIIAYSHPKVVGVVQWGFWEGLHWKPDAALVRKDFSLKPAALVWDEWVNKKWRTNETLRSDAAGSARIRAFQGEYEITARLGGRKVTRDVVLKKDETLVLELPDQGTEAENGF